MAKNLKLDRAIDENLKVVVDDDGTPSSLSISREKTKITNLDVSGDMNIKGDVIVQGKVKTLGGGLTSLVDNTGASTDLESDNNVVIRSADGCYTQIFDGDNIILEFQGGGAGNNIKFYQQDNPSSGGVDFASIGVANDNGQLNIQTTSLSDADIYLGCISGQIRLNAVTQIENDAKITAEKKLYFDGGTHTYIAETAADVLTFKVGNVNMLLMVETSDNNVCWFKGSSAGFTQAEVSYNATDTDVEFTSGNKLYLAFGAGDIADLNLKFPDVSCNCQLVIKQDGTGGRTVAADGWLTTDQAGGNASTVKWAGGSPPTLSTGANAVDIISFYWDNTNHIAYGVASLNFS